MKQEKIAVLMATYNGEKYIREQIDSILNQKDVDLDLYIFDDVSKDGTVEILKEYSEKYKNVKYKVNEKNKNYTYNFIDALFSFKGNKTYDYYAFSDQDDFWVDDKLSTAIKKLKEMGECSLYSSNLKLVDKNLEPLNRNYRNEDFTFKKHDNLLICLTIGCTAVFDKKFKDLVVRQYPENLVFHDYWIGLIANLCKQAHYFLDLNPEHIYYRQHGNNASGVKIKWGIINKIKHFFKGYDQNSHILSLLLKYYSDCLTDDDRVLIEKFIDYKRWKNKKFVMKHIDCSNKGRVKFKLLFNRYISK